MNLRSIKRALSRKPAGPSPEPGRAVASGFLARGATPFVEESRTAILERTRGGKPGGRELAAPLAQENRSTGPAGDAGADWPLDPGLRDLRARLERSGTPEDLVEEILGRVQLSGARGAYAIDAAAQAIGRLFRVLPSPRRPAPERRPHRIAFVGPTGAGKTSVVAKLGRRMRAAGRGVVFATLDPLGVGQLEGVASRDRDADRGEIPLLSVRGAGELRQALRRSRGADCVLLDTPGLAPRALEEIDVLARELRRMGRGGPGDAYLVLPASAGRSAIELALSAFGRLAPAGVVLTKLDETDEPGVVLGAILRADLPVAFLGDGQDLRGFLRRPKPDQFADLLLRGRLA